MRTSDPGSPGRDSPMRIMIVDDHDISRAACRALLRAEGVAVVADLSASAPAVATASTLRPDVVIVDVTPAVDTGFGIARGLRALSAPPIVILTSSADHAQFHTQLDGYRFLPKADLSATAIAGLAAIPDLAGPDRRKL
jgi:DNA-binding NarL/FixJ family response regulator